MRTLDTSAGRRQYPATPGAAIPRRARVRLVSTLAVAFLAGCGADGVESGPAGGAGGAASAAAVDTPEMTPPPPAPQPAPAAPAMDTVPPASGWTAGIVQRRRPTMPPATLASVRTGRHEGFDRIVFDFAGTAVPGYHIEYVDRPIRQCGSGNVVPVAGDGWLRIRLEPARAHDDAGRATVRSRNRRPDLSVVEQLVMTCDFEGKVEWVAGTAEPNRYRVTELTGPARLVVDVRR